MRKESAQERAAWTAAVEGKPVPKESKYHNKRSNGYASKHEERVARDLQVLADGGVITDLREQVAFTLVPGRNGIRGIKYIADFTWIDNQGWTHIGDAKGMKTPVYLLKKKMMYILYGLTIEEL